jgi:hypothetical protein
VLHKIQRISYHNFFVSHPLPSGLGVRLKVVGLTNSALLENCAAIFAATTTLFLLVVYQTYPASTATISA